MKNLPVAKRRLLMIVLSWILLTEASSMAPLTLVLSNPAPRKETRVVTEKRIKYYKTHLKNRIKNFRKSLKMNSSTLRA